MQKLQTKKSNKDEPPRILIHGSEGTGKSTFASKSERVIFLSPEDGCGQLTTVDGAPVDMFLEEVVSWDGAMNCLDDLINIKHDFKTLCIDSVDWLERLAHKKIVGTSGKSIITVNGGWGSGHRESEALHLKLIAKLSALRALKKMTIILVSHTKVKTVKDPSVSEDYDSFEVDCHDLVNGIYSGWVDALLFVKFNTHVAEGETKKVRAYSDQKLTCYTVQQPSFQAKNRYGLPPKMPFTETFFEDFMAAAGLADDEKESLLKNIEAAASQIKDKVLLKKINSSVESAGSNTATLKKVLKRLGELK